jgi:hypothetical protein
MDTRTLARLAGISLLACLSTLAGCAKNEPMRAASLETPEADGMVSTELDENGNLMVGVTMEHLAPPSRLAPSATAYVVWLDAPGVFIQNVGALKLDGDRNGTLEFVTRLRVFRVVVTPEAHATVSTPYQRAVFTADVNEK